MRLKVSTDKQEWIKATSDVEKGLAKSMTATVRQMARETRDGVRQSIAAAGFGSHWTNSIRSLMLSKGDVLNPEAWVHSTINFSDVFETGKQIVGNPLLWLPLPAVPPWPGDPSRQMSPRKYIQVTGQQLHTIRRPGRTPLLGAIIAIPTGTKLGHRPTKANTRRFGPVAGRSATLTMVPLFVGIPAVQIEKRFDFSAALSRVNEGAEDNLNKKLSETPSGGNVQWQ